MLIEDSQSLRVTQHPQRDSFRRPIPQQRKVTSAEDTRINQNLCDVKYALHAIYSNLCTKTIF